MTIPKYLQATLVVCLASSLFLLTLFVARGQFSSHPFGILRGESFIAPEVPGIVPQPLLGIVYNETDFINEIGVTPPFWDCKDNKCNTTKVWGPCFPPHGKVNWYSEMEKSRAGKNRLYAAVPLNPGNAYDESGYCRPGFLIIGAGKCGTSSLYQYITQHPRVLPAAEKQIHYFKYYSHHPMKWYYNHFPIAKTFLSSGALMTGEASPGYIPYPEVAAMIKERLPGPKLIAIGREPIDRAYSSYLYSYVDPLIKQMRRGSKNGIEASQPEEYYDQFIFSFEEMIRAELTVLKQCLAPNGTGATVSKDMWGSMSWFSSEYQRREQLGLPPMVDLYNTCYGTIVNSTVLRPQWAELVARNPRKVIPNSNLHLLQSMLGRSLYALPLEWWYAVFDRSDIYFMCTEELNDPERMNDLAMFLGLPRYDFTDVIRAGAYNVRGHTGYETEVSWLELSEEEKYTNKTIPLSDDLHRVLVQFLEPMNERLFHLIGRRCNWTYHVE